MIYLKPIEVLETTIKRYQFALVGLMLLLGICLIAVPASVKNSNPLLIATNSGIELAQVSPWTLTVERLERFSKAYLENRFVWNTDTFNAKKDNLKQLVSDQVFLKLKESFSSFQSIAQSQGAKSYYVLEDFGFSNAQGQIEVKVTKILRIQNVAVATPLNVLINYQDSKVTTKNPFGLTVVGVQEIPLSLNSN